MVNDIICVIFFSQVRYFITMKKIIRMMLNDALNGWNEIDSVCFNQMDYQIDVTKNKQHGDYATNVALIIAKRLKKNPRDIALELVKRINFDSKVNKVDIAGPGFINFFIDHGFVQRQLNDFYINEKYDIQLNKKQTVVIDYSSPNIAKEMHVGNLRSTIIGDAITRVLDFMGYCVIRQNHVGDWGTQFGMLLAYFETLKLENKQDFEVKDLEAFYREAKKRFDSDENFALKARTMVVALQSGDTYCVKLWKELYQISVDYIQNVYAKLGVLLTLEDMKGESTYNDDLPTVIALLEQQHLIVEDDGAKCVFLEEFKNKEGNITPIIVQKKGGGYLYSTTDLAAIRYRVNVLKANRLIYLVDQRQGLHFEQVFLLARKAHFLPNDVEAEHFGFGTMNGEDGRPFKTRTGGTVKLIELLDEAKKRALETVEEKRKDLSKEEKEHIASVIGMSAIKYADLSKNRHSDYIFSFDRMLSFEGNTAPYLLYAYTRCAKLLIKAESIVLDWSLCIENYHFHEKEWVVANKLLQFNTVICSVAKTGMPHLLCTYLYELATAFSSLYENLSIFSEENDDIKVMRLKLVFLTARTLKTSLSLLGINVLEKM